MAGTARTRIRISYNLHAKIQRDSLTEAIAVEVPEVDSSAVSQKIGIVWLNGEASSPDDVSGIAYAVRRLSTHQAYWC